MLSTESAHQPRPESPTLSTIPASSTETPSGPTYLQSLLAKTLRVTTKDGRFFVGELECTDRDANIILARTTEYRQPSAAEVRGMLENHGITGRAEGVEISEADGKVKVDLRRRGLGLVVVPGRHVVKIEVEESGR